MTTTRFHSWFRHSPWDSILVLAALAHGAALLSWPSVLLIGAGMWWCANTVAHNFIHLAFFRSRVANRLFSTYLSMLLGVPQTLWRQRHLAHHAERPWRWRGSGQLAVEAGVLLAFWSTLAAYDARWFALTYVPGWLLGMLLCHLQGHYEHARGTTSHYGWLYNAAFFNDGYHVEHHQKPARHWRALRAVRVSSSGSRWPAILRWIEYINLEALERLALRARPLQRFMLRSHQHAFARLLGQISRRDHIAIVGGALFPRTAMLLQEEAPAARLTIIDCNQRHIEIARTFLNGSVVYDHRTFCGDVPAPEYDLVVIPLSYAGDRETLYRTPPARALLVHDWIWRRRGNQSAIISWLLLKRLNLVRQ